MSAILWIDREKAKLFNLEDGNIVTSQLHSHDPSHHTHVVSQDEKTSPRFFKEVLAAIKSKKKIAVLGPGLAKKHFCDYVEKHDPNFYKNLTALITVDHPTDNQIKEYFKLIEPTVTA